MKVMVTGATGFIGSHFCTALNSHSIEHIEIVRREDSNDKITVKNLATHIFRAEDFHEVTHVVHLAARVHHMKEEPSQKEEYKSVNVDGTLNIARQAIKYNVRRFIFISSIKVNGEKTEINKPFKADDIPSPQDAYSISKYQAENELIKLCKDSPMELIIIRIPLVYGPGVGANFYSLIKLVKKTFVLPFGAIRNKRSLLAVNNLVNFMELALSFDPQGKEIYLLSDDDDVSTSELLRKIIEVFGFKTLLIPIPHILIYFTLSIFGLVNIRNRILGSLTVDISETKEISGWVPICTMKEQLLEMRNNLIKSGDK